MCSGCVAYAQATPDARSGQQPPPFVAPNPPTPPASAAPGQQAAPEQQIPPAPPDAPLPQPDRSTVDLRDLPSLSPQPSTPASDSQAVAAVAKSGTAPQRESPSRFEFRLLDVAHAYRTPRVPDLSAGSPLSLDGMVRDGKLYISLADAIALALANNLDVEVSRYNLLLADSDLTRARGGGTLRGLDYSLTETPPGVGATVSPLLITSSTSGVASPTSVNVTDLSQVTEIGSSVVQSLAENSGQTFSAGPPLPLYDPVVTGEAGYYLRTNQVSLIDTGTAGGGPTGSDGFVSLGLDLQQGFSTGAQVEAYIDNAAEVLYSDTSQYNPFHAPATSFTVTQPLLRGGGRGVNLRFVRIAKLDQQVSRLVFKQQLLETVYGVSRLYFDLVSLGENIGVKQQSLAAAQKLYEDDKSQVDEGTLAPIELTRAQALVSSSRLDLIQAEGEYRQQEVILREQLLRRLGDPAANFASIIPTDQIVVPEKQDAVDIPGLIRDALANRPDLAQAGLQTKADELELKGSKNNIRPGLNLYGNVQIRGSALAPYLTPGTPGTGMIEPSEDLTQGGLRLSTVYQGGLQLNLPLRNRIAQADAVRDAVQLRQAQGRTLKLESDIRQQVENSAIALETAYHAYAAAVESRNYQQQLLQAEIDKFSVGESTNYLVIQDQAYLAQARSTEVAARSDWMKARLALDRMLGDLLEKDNVQFDDVVRDQSH